MSDHVGDTSDEGRETTPEGTEEPDGGVPPEGEPTSVYGTAGATDPGSDGPATAVYGTARAAVPGSGSDADGPATSVYGTAVPQWSTPGEPSPQPTAVQPLPGAPAPAQPAVVQPGAGQWSPSGPAPGSPPTQAYPQMQPATTAYGVPQPAPTAQAQQVPTSHAPAGYASTGPAPTGGRHWNLWAGIPAAAAVYALGGLWRLIRIGTTVVDFPLREQVAIGVMAAGIVAGVLTLVALASRRRALAAPVAFVLGGVLLIDVVYGWYLQMDRTFSGFDANFLLDTLIPLTLPPLLLAVATMAGALAMRVDPRRR